MGDAGFSIGMLLGFIAGIGAGTGIGIAIGKQQKPWSELSEKERKLRIGLIALGAVLLVAGIVAFFLVS